MPFSTLRDPIDVARAHAALQRAWSVVARDLPQGSNPEAEMERLAYIVAGFAVSAVDESDLVQRSIAMFRATA